MIDYPRYWREREERLRALASEAVDPISRVALELVADSYKRHAERAERREQTGTE